METINTNHTGSFVQSDVQLVVLYTCKGLMIIPVGQIIRIQSISNYSKLFLSNGKSLVVAKVLHWFEDQARLFSFVRIHRSHFINIQYIQSYSGHKTGLLSLLNGEIFPVARRKKAALARRINTLNSSYTDKSACLFQVNNKKNWAT